MNTEDGQKANTSSYRSYCIMDCNEEGTMAFIASHHPPSLTGIFSSGIASFDLPATIVDLQPLLPNPATTTSWLTKTVPMTLPMPSPLSFLFTASGDPLSPLVLSCIAGASTSLGAMVVFFLPMHLSGVTITTAAAAADYDEQSKFLEQFLSFSLSLAASVMITVSVISILPEALEGVLQFQPEHGGLIVLSHEQLVERTLGFGAGCLAYLLLSRVLLILPEPESIIVDSKMVAAAANEEITPYAAGRPWGSNATMSASFHAQEQEGLEAERIRRASSWRMAMLIFISLLLHNAPEGFAVAASASESNELGLVVTIGIMMHNIPEGLAIAVPCLLARPDRPWLAFGLASLSGLAEPIGALVALQLLHGSGSTSMGGDDGSSISPVLPLGDLLAAVAGVMCLVSIRDLYPEARRHILPSSSSTTATSTVYSDTTTTGSTNKEDYSTIWMGTICGVVIMSATEFLLIPR